MRKNRRKKGNYNIAIIISIICLVAAGLVLLLRSEHGTYGRSNDNTNSDDNSEEKQMISFPYELEEGKIEILSMFQASIENPDCNNEIGEDTAALEIINKSEEYCHKAVVKVILEDGTEFEFEATDIPPGKTVWAFDINNSSIVSDYVCAEVTGKAEFGDSSFLEDKVSFDVEEMTITVQNETDEVLTNILVKCHCLFEDIYFGGITYEYPISAIPADGQVVIDAVDCFMGTAEVVGIIKNEQ